MQVADFNNINNYKSAAWWSRKNYIPAINLQTRRTTRVVLVKN